MVPFLKRILPLTFGLILLYVALKDVSFTTIAQQFHLADYRWILLMGILLIITLFLRGMRGRQPLLALGYTPTTFRVTVALLAGTTASMIIPGSGELTRCATLQRTDGVAFSQAVGAVVAERVLDLLALLAVVVLTIVLEFDRLRQYFGGYALRLPSATAWWLLLAGLVLAGLLLWQIRLIDFTHPRWQRPLAKRIVGFGQGLWEGLLSIRKLPRPGLFITLTILNQVMAWLMTYCLMMSLPTTRALPLLSILTTETVAFLGAILVPTQGGIGTYHLLIGRVLMLYGLPLTQATALATFLHAVNFAMTLFVSSIGFLVASFFFGKGHVAKTAHQTPIDK